MKNSACFFRNSDCEFFPCHKIHDMENFNCLFCYCPLYRFADCGGNHETLPNGIKDCSNCSLPHRDYDTIIERLKKRVSIMKNVNVIQCKECKYFELNAWGEINGVPLIIAHEICMFWGKGCKTNPEGYCFAGESNVYSNDMEQES